MENFGAKEGFGFLRSHFGANKFCLEVEATRISTNRFQRTCPVLVAWTSKEAHGPGVGLTLGGPMGLKMGQWVGLYLPLEVLECLSFLSMHAMFLKDMAAGNIL